MAQVAYEDVVEGTDVQGGILADKKFFLTQRVPQRSRFLLLIEANGGHVMKLEKQADYIIADHMRHDAPSGSLSYTFIEAAIAQGHVPNEGDHLAGLAKNTPRPVGSAAPGKSTRTPFSAEDDRQLYEWVKSAELAGVSIKGNELYKQLEAKVMETDLTQRTLQSSFADTSSRTRDTRSNHGGTVTSNIYQSNHPPVYPPRLSTTPQPM